MQGLQLSLDGPGGTILDILRADAAMHTWLVVMAILLGGRADPEQIRRANARADLDHDRLVRAGCAPARLQGRAPVRLDRSDIGRMKISRALIWAFQVALVLLCLALSLK